MEVEVDPKNQGVAIGELETYLVEAASVVAMLFVFVVVALWAS